MERPVLVDGRNVLDPDEARASMFAYESIGRPSSRDSMEAIMLAGGKAERLGDAARGRPKALVPVGGRPLAAYQVARLSRGRGRARDRQLRRGRNR